MSLFPGRDFKKHMADNKEKYATNTKAPDKVTEPRVQSKLGKALDKPFREHVQNAFGKQYEASQRDLKYRQADQRREAIRKGEYIFFKKIY